MAVEAAASTEEDTAVAEVSAAAVDSMAADTMADRITIIIGMVGGGRTIMAMAAVASACSCRLYFCP
jgi:alanyl-tRNA synthetase